MNINYTVLHLLRAMYIERGIVIFTDESTFSSANGVLCMDALSRWYNPFTARPLIH